MKNYICILVSYLISSASFSQKIVSFPSETTIGSQTWMQKNLDVDRFRNGDLIPEARTKEEWERCGEQGKPCWCYYDNNSSNGKIYGKLYNWYAVNDSRGLAPKGWHIPSDDEWELLSNHLGGESVAGDKLKSIDYRDRSSSASTNSIGFKAIPSGMRDVVGGSFSGIGTEYNWWSSSPGNSSWDAYYRRISNNYAFLDRGDFDKNYGLSVRCVKD